MRKLISLILVLSCVQYGGFSQGSISKKQFDELWNKADSSAKIIMKTGSSTKDLNATEKNSIQSIDVKQKTVTNPNYTAKPVDTSNLEELSTQPIVKGVSKTKTISKTKEAVVDTKIKPKETNIETKTKEAEKTVIKATEPVKPKKTYTEDDFSTQPIVKGKESSSSKSTSVSSSTPSKKVVMDTSKGFRDFTFETSPVVNNNASYNRRNEPMPKSKEQIEDEIPVNRKTNNTNVNSDNAFMKEAYAQYDKEADSLHSANKRRLDSIMQALNIKVPIVINPTEFIDIFVNGGGTLSDGNSKQYDRISILHTGVVQREYKTKNEGVQRSEKKISKDELTKLAQYIVDMGFFDFNTEYDCADEDAACNQRFSKSPQPVPMELALTVGQKKHKVKVAIYAPKTEKNLVNYPATLEKIMNALYTIVEK